MDNRILSILLLALLLLSLITPVHGLANAKYKEPRIKQLTYPIAVVGDDYADDIDNVLINYGGYSSSDVVHFNTWSDLLSSLSSGDLYSLVIINDWGEDPGSGDNVVSLLKAVDLRDIPLLILDTGYVDNGGGEILEQYSSDVAAAGYPAPTDHIQYYPSPEYVLIDIVDNSHPIFSGITEDPYQVANSSNSNYCDYALYPDFTGATVTRLAWLNDTYHNKEGYGIAEWVAPGGEHWIFHSSGGVSTWMRYTEKGSDGQYSNTHRQVLLNIVDYLIGTGNPHPPPKGVVYGYVLDADTGEPISGAVVSAGAISNTTNSTGYYELHLDEGTYNISVSAITHRPATVEVTVIANTWIEKNITLTKKPKADIFVAIIGDYADYSGYGTDLYNFLSWNYSVVYYTSFDDFIAHKDDYDWDVIILHWLTYSPPDIDDFISFLRWADSNNIPLIILDEWYYGYPAGYYMYKHSSEIDAAGYVAPNARSEGSDDTSDVDVVIVNTTHPVFINVSSPYSITDYSTTYYAYYTGFTKPVRVLANLSISGTNKGVVIAEWKAPQNESWIFISYASNTMHRYNVSGYYGYYTEEAKKVLINAIDYAASTKKPPIYVTIHGYVKDESGSPISGARVELYGLGIYNYTDTNGYYELHNVSADLTAVIRATKLGYYIYEDTLHIGYADIEYNITLKTKPPSIVVVGDYETSGGKLDLNLTLSQWWVVEEASDYKELWDIINYEGNVLAVIFNRWTQDDSTPPSDDIIITLQLLDNHSIPVIFLAGYYKGAIYPLYYHRSDIEDAGYPAPDKRDYWTSVNGEKLWINMTDPSAVFFKNIAPDTDDAFHIVVDKSASQPYRGYNFTDETIQIYAWFHDKYHDQVWVGVGVWNTSSGTPWVFLIGASTRYIKYTETGSSNRYNLKMILLLNNTINYVLGLTPPTLTGKLYGHVYDEHSNPLSGVKVEIVELGLVNNTDSSGYYEFNNIPAGTYTIRATLFGYYTYEATISISPGINEYNIVLHEVAPGSIVLVVGDSGEDLYNALSLQGFHVYDVENYSVLLNIICSDPEKIGVVVFNSWGDTTPDADIVVYVLQILDAYNIPVIFLDSWGYSTYNHGGYILYEYHDEIMAAGYPAPIERTTGYTENVLIIMNDTTSPLFNGITPDYDNAFYIGKDTSKYSDYAYYTFDPSSGVTVVGDLMVNGKDKGAAVAIWASPSGEVWIFLSASASYKWMKYSVPGDDNQYSDKMLTLLINAINYANSTRGPTPTKISVTINVLDSITLTGIENAEILVNETGNTYYTTSDGKAYIELPITCGNYTLIISKSGYVSVILSIYGYFNKTYEVLLNQYGNATITGVVYDAETGDPLPGVIVEVPGVNSTITGPDGRYTLIIPAGRWTLIARKTLYLTYSTTVVASANTTVTLDIYLHPTPPVIAVVGDYNNDITDYLTSLGYNVQRFTDWKDLYDNLSNYRISIVILDILGSPSAENLTNLLKELDTRNISIIFLDSWGEPGGWFSDVEFAGYYMYEYHDEVIAVGYPAPISRTYHYRTQSEFYVNVTVPEHPVFNGIAYDLDTAYYLSDLSETVDYAGYIFPIMKNLSILAKIHDNNYGDYDSIVVWVAPGGERWVFISYGSSRWGGYYYSGEDFDFSDTAKQVFINIIEFINTTYGVVNGSVTIRVIDYLEGTPIENAVITIPELGLTLYTNSSGEAMISLEPGQYLTWINKSGYINTSILLNVSEYMIRTETIYLSPLAILRGYILDEDTGSPIVNATIRIITPLGTYETRSSSDGSYYIEIPAGGFNVTVSHPLYYTKTITEQYIGSREVKVLNITLTKLPPMIILIGDESDHDLEIYLETLGYYVEVYDNLTDVVNRIEQGVEVKAVIFNYLSSTPPLDEVLNLVHKLDEENISLIILDTYTSYRGTGGLTFYQYKDELLAEGYPAPETREISYTSSIERVKYVIKTQLYGFTYDIGYNETLIADPSANYVNYAYYTFPSTVLIDEVADLKYEDTILGITVAVWYAPGGERWIFMSVWSNYWNRYSSSGGDGPFAEEAKEFLVKAVEYAAIRRPRIDVLNVTVKYQPMIGPGDKIYVSGYAYVRSGNTRIPLANSQVAVYALSDPLLLGTIPTDSTGFFNGSVTVPANITQPSFHTLGIGDPANQYEPTIILPGGEQVLVIPAPEPSILPLLLLVAILLLLITLRKRK